MSNQTNHENQPPTIKDIINTIESKTADGGYIYRGERELHKERPYSGKVSSNLWREYRRDDEHFNIEVIQKELLNAAKKHIGQLPQDYRVDYTAPRGVSREDTDEANDFEILTDIQHYGGKTNLIDFTTDYFIALFFACDGSPDDDGRVILQKTDLIKKWIKYPQNPRHRVIVQKSVFVRPPGGFIEPQEDDIVIIPKNLKQPMLQHLRKFHGISTETIYNDLHGFIRNQDIHGDVYTHFCRGVDYKNRGDEATDIKEKQKEYKGAITHYTKAIDLKPDFLEAYNNRGITYHEIQEFDLAIEDYNMVIKIDPNYAGAYNNRGIAYDGKGDFDSAMQDFETAIQLNPNLFEAYNNRGNFYRKNRDFDLAIKGYNMAIKIDPNYAGAYNNRGIAYNSKGDFDLAIKDFETAIQLMPDLVEAYSNRGTSYHKKDDFDLAIKDYNMAIKIDPNYAIAYNNRGFAYNSKGDFDLAIKDYNMAIELDPNYTTARNNLNTALRNLQNMKNENKTE